MDLILTYVIPFLVVLTVLVFVHEYGHFWVARRCGVRVETFSIGFGRELFGWNDRHRTRWKFSLIPLGGYVKFFGDQDAASTPDPAVRSMDARQRADSFFHKPLWQRAAIVVAGPMANFLFAVIVLFGLFLTIGHPFPSAQVGEIEPASPAARAGLLPGDRINAVDGESIARFTELALHVRASQGEPLRLSIARDGAERTVTVQPEATLAPQEDGTSAEIYRVGIAPDIGPYGFVQSAVMGVTETVALSGMILHGVGEMITGARGAEDLGGPIRIAQMSGDVAQLGFVVLIWFMAILSINLGLINLFPIPMLDGGHLMFYAVEALRGRPLGPRAQEYGFRFGLALVLALMVFATWNDIVQLNVVGWVANLVS